jgi:hypothetical protein
LKQRRLGNDVETAKTGNGEGHARATLREGCPGVFMQGNQAGGLGVTGLGRPSGFLNKPF